MNVQLVVYFAGVLLLGVFYAPLKQATGGGALFVAAAVAYLLILRVIGQIIAKPRRPSG